MNSQKYSLLDLGISKQDFIKIEQDFRKKFTPNEREYTTVVDFYDYLNNQLFVMGSNDFKEFITTEKEKSKARLTKHFGNTLVSYLCGIDFRIYTIILERIESNNKGLYNIPFIGKLFSKHLTISEKIKDAYYSLVPQPSENENVPQYYVGKLNHYNQPYRVQVYGAYPLMTHWEMIVYKMENANDESGYFKQWEKEKVFEAMKEYAKGFQQGYNDFLKDIIDNKDNLSSSEAIRFQRIKDYVFNLLHNEPGFSETVGKGIENTFSRWYEDGKEGGYYYRAWYLILDNHLAFSPLFEIATKYGKSKVSKPLCPEPSLFNRFDEIKEKFYNSNDGKPSKIQKAAMIDLLSNRGYFGKQAKPKNGKNPVRVWQSIAANYFDEPILAELESSKKNERQNHKTLLEKYLK